MGTTYLVFIVQGFDEYSESDGVFKNIVNLQLIAKDYDEAVGKAKKIVTKNNYRLIEVIEKEHGT